MWEKMVPEECGEDKSGGYFVSLSGARWGYGELLFMLRTQNNTAEEMIKYQRCEQQTSHCGAGLTTGRF